LYNLKQKSTNDNKLTCEAARERVRARFTVAAADLRKSESGCGGS
jgi:hypothetical protein